MTEAILIAFAVVAGVEWRRLVLAAGAVWAPVPAAAAVVAAAVVGMRFEHQRSAGSEVRFIETVIGELRAGGSLRSALRRACDRRPEAAPIVRRLDVGEPLPRAVHGLGGLLPTVGALVETAVASGGEGGRMLPVFEELLVHAAAEDQAAAELRTALAPVRATMTVLVGAPGAYLVWSAVTGRLGRLLALPGGLWVGAAGMALFLAGVGLVMLLARTGR